MVRHRLARLCRLGLVLSALLPAAPARALDPDNDDPVPVRVHRTRPVPAFASRGASSVAAVAETVFVGFTPGHSGDNYWSIWAGAGKEGFGRPSASGGCWDFEPAYDNVHGDSLQGWWPYRFRMIGTGGLTLPDVQRPWKALDYGNNANYSGPFGASAGGSKRTFGVVGVWHVDSGNTAAGAGQGVGWEPLAGTGSAWMGLRRHGDVSHAEDAGRGGTGNAYNEDVLMFQHNNAFSTGGSDKRFPGYGSQMDQLLYRDIDLGGPGDTSLTVSFVYRTAMSTSFTTSNATRAGWFVHDPLVVATGGSNPNFISNNSLNPAPPADSMLVYVGAPAEGSVLLSDGQLHAIGGNRLH